MKRLFAATVLSVACLGLVACGSNASTEGATSDAVVETPVAETPVVEAPATETPAESTDATEVEDVTAENAGEADGAGEVEVTLDTMDKAEIAAFADSVKKAVADKNIEALAELTAFPTYVGLDDVQEVATKEDFIAIGADKLFTEELVASMETVDTSALTSAKAGVTLGETASVTFNLVEGKLGIVGINF